MFIPHECRKWAALQITQCRESEDEYFDITRKQYLAIRPFLLQMKQNGPSDRYRPPILLDVGCGLGRMSAAIAERHELRHVHLADFTGLTEGVDGGWNPEEYKCNDLTMTKLFMYENGVYDFTF